MFRHVILFLLVFQTSCQPKTEPKNARSNTMENVEAAKHQAPRKGIRLSYEPRFCKGVQDEYPHHTINRIQRRLADTGNLDFVTTFVENGNVVVEIASIDITKQRQVRKIVEEPMTGLRVSLVDENSDFMKRVHDFVLRDKGAAELKIRAASDEWQHFETGTQFIDYYLWVEETANHPSHEVLKQFLLDFVKNNQGLNNEEKFAFEHKQGEGRGEWRSYYLESTPAILESQFSSAVAVLDTTDNLPKILVKLSDTGAVHWEKLTSQNIGKKAVVALGERVLIAPTISAPIPGGELVIDLGHNGPQDTAQNVIDLLTEIRAGIKPCTFKLSETSSLGR